MMMMRRTARQAGYTLIELLVYVSIVGVLLISVTYFFALAAESRVKNQTIAEVNDQGGAIMDNILQTIRNATSITAPATGATGSSLTLVVPTSSFSPTVFNVSGSGTTIFGYNTIGASTDADNSNVMDAEKFTASATGTISTLNAHVGATIGASPNNKAQMAIYSGTASVPTTLLASSADTVLTANSWASFSISPVSVTSGQIYWLVYNANGLNTASNVLSYDPGSAGIERFTGTVAYGTWPSSWPASTAGSFQLSLYGTIVAGGSGAFQIKEGAGSAIALTNSKVQVTGLTFKNLTKSGTGGLVQVSFTVSRLNPTNRNEYDYQKTFTSSAEVSW